MAEPTPRDAFIEASVWHGSLDRASGDLLASHPEIASSDIHTAAILGDDVGVRRFLALDRRQRHGQERAVGMGRADPSLLLEVPSPRQVPV